MVDYCLPRYTLTNTSKATNALKCRGLQYQSHAYFTLAASPSATIAPSALCAIFRRLRDVIVAMTALRTYFTAMLIVVDRILC